MFVSAKPGGIHPRRGCRQSAGTTKADARGAQELESNAGSGCWRPPTCPRLPAEGPPAGEDPQSRGAVGPVGPPAKSRRGRAGLPALPAAAQRPLPRHKHTTLRRIATKEMCRAEHCPADNRRLIPTWDEPSEAVDVPNGQTMDMCSLSAGTPSFSCLLYRKAVTFFDDSSKKRVLVPVHGA